MEVEETSLLLLRPRPPPPLFNPLARLAATSSTPMTFIASRRLALLPLLFLLLFLSSFPADTVSAATSIARPKHHVNWRTFLKQTAPNSLLRGAQLTDLTALLQISASEGGQLAYTTSEASGNEAVRYTHMMVDASMQMVAARMQEDITSLHEYTFSSIRVCGLAIPLPACCEQVHRSSSRHLPDCCCDPPLLRDTTIFHSRLTSLSSVSHCVPRPPRHPRSPSPLTPLLPILTHPLPHAPLRFSSHSVQSSRTKGRRDIR